MQNLKKKTEICSRCVNGSAFVKIIYPAVLIVRNCELLNELCSLLNQVKILCETISCFILSIKKMFPYFVKRQYANLSPFWWIFRICSLMIHFCTLTVLPSRIRLRKWAEHGPSTFLKWSCVIPAYSITIRLDHCLITLFINTYLSHSQA